MTTGDYGTRFTRAELEQIAAQNAAGTADDDTAEWTWTPGDGARDFTRELAAEIREESERTADDPFPPGTVFTRPNAGPAPTA